MKPLPPIQGRATQDGEGLEPSLGLSSEWALSPEAKIRPMDMTVKPVTHGKRRSMSVGEMQLNNILSATSPPTAAPSKNSSSKDRSPLDASLHGIISDFGGEISQALELGESPPSPPSPLVRSTPATRPTSTNHPISKTRPTSTTHSILTSYPTSPTRPTSSTRSTTSTQPNSPTRPSSTAQSDPPTRPSTAPRSNTSVPVQSNHRKSEDGPSDSSTAPKRAASTPTPTLTYHLESEISDADLLKAAGPPEPTKTNHLEGPIVPPRSSSLQTPGRSPSSSSASSRRLSSRHPTSPTWSRNSGPPGSAPARNLHGHSSSRDLTRLRVNHRSTASSSEPSLIQAADDTRVGENIYCLPCFLLVNSHLRSLACIHIGLAL
jgi:hypothetical protein